jgi:hypothetical protein
MQNLPFLHRIGGLVVKLAVAMRDSRSQMSASPGFDSRPMHFCAMDVFVTEALEGNLFWASMLLRFAIAVRYTVIGPAIGFCCV